MARALKTFCYSDGFHTWTVAASSRPKALAAFGVTRDLFKDGSAKEIDSGPDREAALNAPGKLIERGLAVDIGKVVKTVAVRSRAAPGAARAKARVDALEAELAALDETQATQTEAMAVRCKALEAAADALAKQQAKARDEAKAKLKAARRAAS